MAAVSGMMRNPLAAVINAHFMVRHTLGDTITPDTDRHLDMAERQTTRAATLADNLTAFVRHREPNPEPVDLVAALHEVLESTPAPSGIEVEVDVVVRETPTEATSPVLNRLFELVLVITAIEASSSKATPVGSRHDAPHSATSAGRDVVTSMAVASLLPLFATTATPSRGSTPTPSGVVPVEIGEPITPTGPRD